MVPVRIAKAARRKPADITASGINSLVQAAKAKARGYRRSATLRYRRYLYARGTEPKTTRP